MPGGSNRSDLWCIKKGKVVSVPSGNLIAATTARATTKSTLPAIEKRDQVHATLLIAWATRSIVVSSSNNTG
jgi:hypothetical protein